MHSLEATKEGEDAQNTSSWMYEPDWALKYTLYPVIGEPFERGSSQETFTSLAMV
jgi:hypothetical protein